MQTDGTPIVPLPNGLSLFDFLGLALRIIAGIDELPGQRQHRKRRNECAAGIHVDQCVAVHVDRLD